MLHRDMVRTDEFTWLTSLITFIPKVHDNRTLVSLWVLLR